MQDVLRFYTEVRVVNSPRRPELEARMGAVLGITEPVDDATPPAYAVALDGEDRLVQFLRDQVEPTGHTRKREDYY